MSKFIGSGKTYSSVVGILTEAEFQNKIDFLYERLGSPCHGVYTRVGFCRKPVDTILPDVNIGREKVKSEFFTFNNVINKLL